MVDLAQGGPFRTAPCGRDSFSIVSFSKVGLYSDFIVVICGWTIDEPLQNSSHLLLILDIIYSKI